MRIGVLSDAHGNSRWTLECVDAMIGLHVESIYFLGDAVGYLPDVDGVVGLLRRHGVHSILGNHEAMLLGRIPAPSPEREAAYRLADASVRMSDDTRQQIESWPATRSVELDGRRLVFVHGSPLDYFNAYIYPDSDLAGLADPHTDVLFVGNTHRPFVRTTGTTLVVNPGSCGMPRDQGDSPSFAIYETGGNTCEILRLELDGEAMAREAEAAGLAEAVVGIFRRRSTTIEGRVVRTGAT